MPKKIRRETLQGVSDCGYRKKLCFRGLCHDFPSKFFASQNRKTLQGNLSVLRFGKFPVSHKFMDEKRGSIKFFRPFFLSHSVGKYRRGLFIVSLTSGMEKNRMSELAVGGGSVKIFRPNFYCLKVLKIFVTLLCCLSETF